MERAIELICLPNIVEYLIIERIGQVEDMGTGEPLYLAVKTAQAIVPYLHQVAGLIVIRTQVTLSRCREATAGNEDQGK